MIPIKPVEKIFAELKKIELKLDERNNFKIIFKQKLEKLGNHLATLEVKRLKRSWESLGSGIKWMAGNPDADDLREIDRKFEAQTSKIDKIANKWNVQTGINMIFEDRINNITHVIREMSNNFKDSINSFQIIELIFNIDTLIERLESIQNALNMAKVKIPSKSLLEIRELEAIFLELQKQKLDVDSIDDSWQNLEAETKQENGIIVYTINIPVVEQGYRKFKVEAIPKNNTEIKLEQRSFIIKRNKTMAIKAECSNTKNIICKFEDLEDISKDNCIPHLIREEPAQCSFKETTGERELKLLEDGTLLLKNAPRTTIFNDCSKSNISAMGTILILFSNCTITINNEAFTMVERETREIELIPINAEIVKLNKLEKLLDLHDLHDLHIKNNERIQTDLEQVSVNQILYTWGSIFTPLAIIAIALAAWKCKKFQILKPISRRQFEVESENLELDDIKRKLELEDIKRKIEDIKARKQESSTLISSS